MADCISTAAREHVSAILRTARQIKVYNMRMRRPDIWNCSVNEWRMWEESPEGAAEKSQFKKRQNQREKDKNDSI